MLNLKGDSSDFSQNWFIDIGDTICGSMVFNVLFPIMMEFGWFSMRLAKRIMDGLGTDDDLPSKSGTLQQYINKFAGPQYFMHYKYSSIMNIVFLTMMFGPGMPILFPVAAASLFVLYCLENYMLYYVYKAPPAYDEVLNNHVLSKLSKAPIFLLAFGFWMYTNPQLQQSYESLTPLPRSSSTFMAEHYWYESFRPTSMMA
jgi:hypothetical protein